MVLVIIRTTLKIRPFVLVQHEGFQYLGVIQNGFQIGALAQTPDGRYVQVNGATVQTLRTQKVRRALKAAEIHRARRSDSGCNTIPECALPLVSFRRRRSIVLEAAR
jgi:hypothetical protein